MKIEIIDDLLSTNEYSRPGKRLSGVNGIVIHYVGNAMTSAKANRDYFESLKTQKNGARYASAHYIVGLTGEIIRCIPETEIAYHAGASSYVAGIQDKLGSCPNSWTLGIEMCHINSRGDYRKETWESAVMLTGQLLRKYKLTSSRLFRHYDVTGKDCPRAMVKSELLWKKFKDECEAARYFVFENGI